ncbi:cadherin domain-containing protein, partial [Microcystis aeruginosa LEGE 11464]|uniref:Calx-beta domain-containing protein n=1 Tax=Microcystis aeruginosa TaxID=1126 RepID=UPI00187E6A54
MLTKIINIEARWGRSVTEFLPAGDYKVEYIGIAQGGQYNAWNYRYNYYPYWSNQYQIDSSEFSFSTGRLSENWGNDTLALANAKNTTFVLKNAGNVTFWIYDTVYEDNTGGVSLRVTSIPTPATNITLSNNNIAENQAVNTVIGDFTSTDPDPGDTFIYSLVSGAGDTDNSFFTISNNQLKSNSVFDYEAKTSYSIRVRTTDQDGQFYEKQLTVNVTNIIEPGTFSFSDNNYVVKEDGTVVKAITINRTNNFEGAVSVTVTPTDGTATSVNDYKNTPIVVNFAAGETSKTVTVPLINDTAYELEENLNLAITNVTGGAIIGTQNKATLTILNDDVAIPGVLAFNAPTYTLTENGTTITQVIVTRTGGSDTEVSGTITLNNGTATAEDYNNTPIKVTFAHGDSAPKIITIPIKEDSQFEAVETLNLSLTNPTNGVTIGTQNTAIVKIIDNDNFVFNNTDIQPTKLEKLTLPIPTALKQYETLSSELDKAKVKLDTTEQQLRLANDDYSFAKEIFEGSLSKRKSLTDILQNLANKKTALTSSFTKSKTEIEQKQKDIQKNIDDAYTRLKAETNAGIKDGIQKEINGYLIQIQEQQNLLSIATTKYNQELAVVIFQIDDSNQELQGLESNIIPKQVEDLEKKNQALVDVKTAWEGNKQAVTVADKALGDFLTDYAFLKTQDYSSKFLQDTVDSLKQKIGALQANLTALKSGNGSNSEIAALEKAILEKQKVVGEVQEYQKTVLAGELEFKQELETRKGTSADHEASVKVALGNNNIEGYVSLNSQLANQLKGLTTVWVDNLEDNHNLTIKVWNGSQATSEVFDSLTSYIDENLATPYGDYYLNEIQLDEALQIRESTVRRRDALADSVDFVEDALFLAKKQLQEYQDLAKLGQHYSDLTKYENEFNQLNVLESKLPAIRQLQQQLAEANQKLALFQQDKSNRLAIATQRNAVTNPITGNKYYLTAGTNWFAARDEAASPISYLIIINDQAEQDFINQNFGGQFWIGASDEAQEWDWRWIDGTPVTYTNWTPGEPNNYKGRENYAQLYYGRWNDLRPYDRNIQGIVEINFQSLNQKETAITQEVEQAKTKLSNALDDLLNSLNSPILQDYLKFYDPNVKVKGDKTADNVQAFINQSELVLQPKLIKAVSDEVTNKSQDLVVQIDLTNDQQEQWIETNLQKYIEQKRDGFTNTLKIPLPVDGYSSFNFIHQPQGLTALFWGNENNSEQLIGDFNGDKKDDIVNLQSDGNNWLALSKGDGSFNFTRPPQGLTALFWGDENNSEQLIGDFNGDKKDDIVNLQSDGNNWLALSKGDGSFNFTRPPQGLTALFWGDENNSEQLI